jgi:AcrR family transcriptional regulator
MSSRSYRARPKSGRSQATRDRINAAVRELLTEGAFHSSTVEQVAERAGVSRATLYQHFGSRFELIDAVCEKLNQNPALVEIRGIVDLPDAGEALDKLIALSIRFWSSEDSILDQLYGVAAVDPAARAFVDRQRADRRSELERLVRTGRLGSGAAEQRALNLLLVLTGYDTFRELREAGLSDRQATSLLQDSARTLLLRA